MDNTLKIKVKKTHPDAVLPAANNKEPGTGDTGFDLVAVAPVHISPGKSAVVDVGLTLADITPGYWIKIEPRSGLGFKNSIQPHLGVIDNGYRGDLGVKLYNFHEKTGISIKKGDKIAQLVVYRLLQPTFEFSEEITETNRGERGFGSSDEKPYVTSQQVDDWWYTNTYQVDQGRVEMARFDTVEEFMIYAGETGMPDTILKEILASEAWKAR